ncbi:hypothetical protein [Marinobacter mangrovi]|uniref:hypothetical protein n=1 Tax=Marinobacter mangrovi TaxID=2803918 RepID=UPI0019317670|nr:hypothetical protein [Marinobacter mangrovi]
MDIASAISMGMGGLPLFFVVLLYKEAKPKYHGLWIFGILIIAIAGMLAGSLDILEHFISEKLAAGSEKEVLKEAQHTVGVWIYIGPAVIAAIGANLVTEFILTDKSSLSASNK